MDRMVSEKTRKRIIKEEINKFLKEVRYIDTDYANKTDWIEVKNQYPIKNTDTIRVFHGCNLKTAVKFAKEGLSGKQWTPRRYGYERDMNPNGLFVTTSFNIAKNFSSSDDSAKGKNASVVIEFSAKASDLDTPVWNGQMSYFGQNSNPQPFHSKEDRDKQKAVYNDFASKHEDEYVKNSDNPAMAYNIFHNNEHQALFVGDLNPNMIKRFWIKPQKHTTYGWVNDSENYIPLKRSEFLKRYGDTEFVSYFGDNAKYFSFQSGKVYLPNEEFNGIEDMAKRVVDYWGERSGFVQQKKANGTYDYDYEVKKELEYINRALKQEKYEYFENILWPKQLLKLFGKEQYMKHYNKFGIGIKE